jgi:hypothetical protein
MPSLDTLKKANTTKLLLIGDSGSGKTGSLASLALDGYKIRMLDFDNGWESLAAAINRTDPSKLSNVEVESFRDKMKSSQLGPIADGMPNAFINCLKLLDNWKTPTADFGKPSEFGADTILVLDSLTFFSDAAFAWAESLNSNAKDKRQIYGHAQEAIEKTLAMLTSPTFNTNVIITAHVKYLDMPDGTKRGYPTSVGQALSPTIPRYFNSVAFCQTQAGGKRTIQTSSTPLIDLKNPAPFKMLPSLPIETGLSDFFKTLRS